MVKYPGLPKDLYDSFKPEENNLLVVDDGQNDYDAEMAKFFTRSAHHRSLTVIFIVQNLFFQSKHSRTISLNANYIVVLKAPRDAAQIGYLARQLYPTQPKFLVEAYKDCTSKPHSYMLLDLQQTTPDQLRVRSSILPNQICHVYQPK